jgi:UPF0755 protein
VKKLLIWTVFAFFALGLSAATLLWYYDLPPSMNSADRQAFNVGKGESVASIAERLEETGIIKNRHLLVLISRLKGTENLFQAGSYLLPRDKTALDIHDYFVSGSQVLVRVTIPEGWTLSRIAAYLEQKQVTSAAEFKKAAADPEVLKKYSISGANLEGFLYPDTYLFQKDFPAEQVVRHMVENFFLRLKAAAPDYKSIKQDELYRKVILASIIEREYRSPEEAPLMASVFYNRLGVNMALGSCATVEYIITEVEKKPHPSYLTYKDLEVNSPYNTYIHPGLPPGPISNAGATALAAAFSPAKTNYWYFVLRDPESGRHYFSKNLDEHNHAKFVYLKKQDSGL